jgi:catechol 2,3-dioxygenase-like lactoylglutathione lyase family enzyme
MIRVKAIDHIVLRTGQPATMLRFYSEVLGCRVERSLPAATGLTQLRAGDALIDLVSLDSELGRAGGGAPGPDGNNVDHFCLRIAGVDADELVRWLSARGVPCGEWATRYGAAGFGPSLYIEDPDGNTVELRPDCPEQEPERQP